MCKVMARTMVLKKNEKEQCRKAMRHMRWFAKVTSEVCPDASMTSAQYKKVPLVWIGCAGRLHDVELF